MAYRNLVSTKNMPKEDWLLWRRKGIGGSDAAAILGIHPFVSRLALWMDKTGVSQDLDQNESMWLGNILETPVAQRASAESGIPIRRNNFILQHTEREWMLANIDYEVVGEKVGVEIKTTSPFNATDFSGGEIPNYYYVQCMHYMAVTGWSKWHLFVYVVGRKLYHFVVERNEEEIQALITAEDDFWKNNVLNMKRPDADGTKSSRDALMSLFPRAERSSMTIGQNEEMFCLLYKSVDSQIAELEARKEEYKQKLQQHLGNFELGLGANYTVKWSNVNRKDGKPSRRFEVIERENRSE